MCFFSFPNKSSKKAYQKGIIEFECGHCPECLQKKSSRWALRCAMQAKVSQGVMVTLTYDTYKVVNGVLSCIEENPTDPNIPLSKRDCQLFLKRLRKHFEGVSIKYLLTAERGSRTGRAHYHALLFGVQFKDLIKYKMSERGNWIYKSKTLNDLWSKGICTVDCININAKTARYCTKYCSKDTGADDTFMLFSRGIGEEEMLKRFNGKSYWIDGREYSIPREIWRKVIEDKYKIYGFSKYKCREHIENVEKVLYNSIKRAEKRAKNDELLQDKFDRYCRLYRLFEHKTKKARKASTRLVYSERMQYYDNKCREIVDNMTFDCSREKLIEQAYLNAIKRLKDSDEKYLEQKEKRDIYEIVRDNDTQYQQYIAYWKEKNAIYDLTRPPIDTRILSLEEKKYRSYKAKAIKARHAFYDKRRFIPPRSSCGYFASLRLKPIYYEKSFAPLSRHNRANDTNKKYINCYNRIKKWYMRDNVHLMKLEIDRIWKIVDFDENLIPFENFLN